MSKKPSRCGRVERFDLGVEHHAVMVVAATRSLIALYRYFITRTLYQVVPPVFTDLICSFGPGLLFIPPIRYIPCWWTPALLAS